MKIAGFRHSERFAAELRGAPPDVQRRVKEILDTLAKNPDARSLRLHALRGYGKPQLFKVDVFSNHSWQITLEVEGGLAILRRLATHRELDRNPR